MSKPAAKKAAAASSSSSGGGDAPVVAPPASGKATFRISTMIKSIEGENIADRTLQEVLARASGRPDVRDPDTPLTGKTKAAKPKSGFPNFRPVASPGSDVSFNPDSITTPHTYAVVHAPTSPKKSSAGAKVFRLLKKAWDSESHSFSYRDNPQVVMELSHDALELCAEAAKILESEPIFLKLSSNVFVIGDVHGNFTDLFFFMNKLLLFGDIEMTPYSFLALGDYVDRGEYSVECVLLCLALKCLSPSTFFMLRGNHEDPMVNGDTMTYGDDCLKAQCTILFGEDTGMTVWDTLNGVFRSMPLAACIDGKIFCSHGGIPRYYGTPENDDRIRVMESKDFPRFRSLFEPLDPSSSLGRDKLERCWVATFDLMWSDPSDEGAELNQWGFGQNDRGESIISFGELAVENFLTTHGMELMFRAHQEKSDGLKLSKSAKCLTIFSSSNYQGHGNGAGVVYVSPTGKVKMIMKEPEA
eukprot:RCo017024